MVITQTVSQPTDRNLLRRFFPRRFVKLTPATSGTAVKAYTSPFTSSEAWMPSYYPDRDLYASEHDYANAYMTSAWVFRALNIRSQKVGSILWRYGRVVNKATGAVLDNHPLMTALDRVFRYYKQDIFEEWQFSKSLYGEAYIELVPMEIYNQRTNNPLTFKLLNALAVEPNIVRGEIRNFTYSGNDGNQRYSIDELVFDRQYNPSDDLRGLSLLVAALEAVNIERGQTRIARAMINNNMRPGLLFTPKEGTVMSEVDAAAIKKTLQEDGKGARNSGRPLFIPFPFDVTVVTPPTFEDQEYLSEQQKRKIAAVIGIPVGLIDHTDSAFQLSPEQKKALYELTLLPAAEKMARIVDTELLPYVDGTDNCRYELPSEEILAALGDPSIIVSVENSKLAAGGISLNEYRAALNMPILPSENGDIHFLPAGSLQVPSDQIGSLQAKPSYMPYGNPSVTIQQAAELAGGAGIHVPQPPPASTNPEGEAPVSLTQGTGGVVDTPPALPASPTVPAINPALVIDADKADDSVPSGILMLSLANNPDLIMLQNQVRKYVTVPCEWNKADEFHITLVYMPGISEDQSDDLLAALEDVELPELSVGVGSLRLFKNPGESAIHFRVLRNAALLDFQKRLAEIVTGLNIPVSSYSLPDNFTPHITMGYASEPVDGVTFRARQIKLTPQSLEFSIGDDVLWDSAETPLNDDAAIEDEIKTWRKFALKHGAEKAGRFVCNAIGDTTATSIRERLATLKTDDKDAIKAVFDGGDGDAAQKAIQATRLNFENDCADLLASATNGSIDRTSFSNKMRALIRNYGRDAYRDGLTDGGIEEPGFDDDDVETINRMVAEQSIYITSLGMVLFRGDGITSSQEDNKPAMWYRKSIDPFYKAGLGAADRNGLYEWVLGDTEEHCIDCLRLNGQKHRLKDWMRRNLIPQSDTLACGGWHCDCKLVKTTGKVAGGF